MLGADFSSCSSRSLVQTQGEHREKHWSSHQFVFGWCCFFPDLDIVCTVVAQNSGAQLRKLTITTSAFAEQGQPRPIPDALQGAGENRPPWPMSIRPPAGVRQRIQLLSSDSQRPPSVNGEFRALSDVLPQATSSPLTDSSH